MEAQEGHIWGERRVTQWQVFEQKTQQLSTGFLKKAATWTERQEIPSVIKDKTFHTDRKKWSDWSWTPLCVQGDKNFKDQKCELRMWSLHLLWHPILYPGFWSSSLKMHLGKHQQMTQILGSLCPCGRPWASPRLCLRPILAITAMWAMARASGSSHSLSSPIPATLSNK